MDKILKIIKAQYVKDYILRLTFNNGEIRMVDFAPLMQKGICKKLQDMDYFVIPIHSKRVEGKRTEIIHILQFLANALLH